jgi:hypothetical protein
MTYDEVFKQGLYGYMLGPDPKAYVEKAATTILKYAGDAKTALSVGCGNGDTEAEIGDRLDLTLHDLHDAARTSHPELHWLPHLPNEQFDYVYAYGAVFACVPQEEKQKFVDDLAARVVDGGTLYISMGYAKGISCCRARAYSVNGKTVTEAVTSKGKGWQVRTTHIWGLCRIDVTYYPSEISHLFEKHRHRIQCVSD